MLNIKFFWRRFVWVNIVGDVMSGDIVHYGTTTNYELGVDGAGKITSVLANGSPLQVPKTFDRSIVSFNDPLLKVDGLGTVKELVYLCHH